MNIVWTTQHCPFCVKAKNLLDTKGIEYETREVDNVNWTIEQLREAVPDARTFPQVILDDKLIGGFDDLDAPFYLKDMAYNAVL